MRVSGKAVAKALEVLFEYKLEETTLAVFAILFDTCCDGVEETAELPIEIMPIILIIC